jgi:multiple sugar transport system permease protein
MNPSIAVNGSTEEKATAEVSPAARSAARTGSLMMAPALVFMTVVGFFPFIHSLYLSLQEYNLAGGFTWRFVGLANYARAINDGQFWNSMMLTGLFTLASVVVSLALAIGLALVFNKDLPGFTLLRTIVLVPMLVTPIAVGIIWRIMMTPSQGLLNYLFTSIGLPPLAWANSTDTALLSILLVDVWEWTPFVFIIIFAGLRALPRSPFEAAAIDGAPPSMVFFHITLPMLKPVIVIAVLLRLIDAMRTYDTVYLLTRGGPNLSTDLASVYLQRINFQFFDLGYGAALSWVFVLLLSIVVGLYVHFSGFLKTMSATGAR